MNAPPSPDKMHSRESSQAQCLKLTGAQLHALPYHALHNCTLCSPLLSDPSCWYKHQTMDGFSVPMAGGALHVGPKLLLFLFFMSLFLHLQTL